MQSARYLRGRVVQYVNRQIR